MNKYLRRLAWRTGRALYMFARGDFSNNPSTNGEYATLERLMESLPESERERKTVLFDIGANIGEWTTNALEIGRRLGVSGLEVHAFEPVPSTFDALNSNIMCRPSAGRVRTNQMALSAVRGDGEIYVYEDRGGTNSLHPDPMRNTGRKTAIRVSTIDAYCSDNNISDVVFIKCDAEGHDFEVLLGARGLFDGERIGLFQFEYNHRWVYSRHFLKDVFDFADGRPYLVGKLTRNGIEIVQKWHPELERFFETNYVVVHRAALAIYSPRVLEIDVSSTYA